MGKKTQKITQGTKRVWLNLKETLKKYKIQVITSSLAILVIISIAIGAIIQGGRVENIQVEISPELAKAMTYPEVEEGENAIDGTNNVKFDAFFLRDLDGDGEAESIRGTSKEIGTSDTLYMELNVLTAGYLEDAKITVNGENFYLQTALPEDDQILESYIGNNIKEIGFKPINNGTQKLLTAEVRSGDYSSSSKKAAAIGDNIKNYSKTNSVTLTGTYVDETGIKTPITKTVEFKIDWYGMTDARISTTSQNNSIEDAINEEKGSISLEFKINTQETKQQLLLSKNYVEGEIPELNGYAPAEVEFTGSNAKFVYNAEDRTFTITREVKAGADGVLTSKLSNSNSYSIKVTYPIEAYYSLGVETIQIKIPVETYYEGFNNQEDEFTNPYKSNVAENTIVANYSRPSGTVARFDVTVGKYLTNPIPRYIVSKEKPLKMYNEVSASELEDKYTVTWKVQTGNVATGKVVMKEAKTGETSKEDHFIKKDSSEESMEEVTSFTGIYFSNPEAMLGEEGEIKVYDDETDILLATFNKENWWSYSGSNPYEYELPVKHIRVETSEVKENTEMNVYNVKTLDDEVITTKYTKEQFDELQYIEANLAGYIGDTFINEDVEEANYEAPLSIASIELSKNTISTQITEKNFKITINALANEIYNQVRWQNGTFLVKLPKEIIEAEINSVTISNSNVSIESYELVEQEGQKFIKIVTKNDIPQTFTITIDTNISPDPRMATSDRSIELYASNENPSEYYYKTQDIYDVNNNLNTQEAVNYRTASISMISPNSLLTNQVGSNYDDKGSTVVSPQIADIKPTYAVVDQEEEKTAQIGVQIRNNYANTISDIVILGKIPFEGNTYVLSGGEIGSTFTTKMVNTGIEIPEELKEYGTVYYSENENPSKDVEYTPNGWKTADEVTNWDNIKTFLIDLGNYVMPTGKEFVFNYTIRIPDGLEFNKVSYSHHGVYFSLDTDEGKYRTQTEPNRIGFRIAEKYNLELTKTQTGTDKVIPGATYSIKEEGQEEGKTAVTNSNGQLTITNLYAEKVYEIQETKTPDDYELNSDIIRFIAHVDEEGKISIEKLAGTTKGNLEVVKNEGEDYKVTVNVEDEVKASLKIVKKEKGTEQKIQGVRFKLTGYNISENGRTITSNSNGEITFSGLTINQEYTLQEIKAEGYYLADPMKFKIINDNGNYSIQVIEGENILQSTTEEGIPVINIEIENEKIPTYDLQITKVKKTTESTISNDELIAKEEAGLANTEVEYLEGAKFKLYKGAEEVGTYTTDSTGKITITGLYQYEDGRGIDQTYTLKEVLAPDGYAKAKDITFKVENIDGKLTLTTTEGTEEKYSVEGNTINLTIEDSPSFRLIKKDAETTERLANAKFAIYNVEDEEKPATNSKGEILGTKETINGKEYYTLTTNENGEITADLTEGLYKVIEVEAPEQYDIEGQTYYFGIGASREAQTVMSVTQAISIEGNKSTQISSVEETNDGGYIIGGVYTGTIEIGNYTLESKGDFDGLVVKYNKQGEVEWATSIGGSKDDYIHSVATTDDGGYIVGGYFQETIKIGNNTLTSAGGSNGIVIKYDSQGEVEWTNVISTNNRSQINSVSETEDGEIFVAGNFIGVVQIGKYELTSDSYGIYGGNSDGLVVKYDKQGEVQWATNIGGNFSEYFTSISSTKDGGCIAAGYYQSVSFKVGNFTIENKDTYGNTSDGIVVKYSNIGEVEWATSFGGDNSEYINSVSSTKDGGCIVGADFSSREIEAGDYKLTNRGIFDGMLIEYDNKGNVKWTENIGGVGHDQILSVSSTKDGGYLVGGFYSNRINLEDNTLICNGERDGIIVKYNNQHEIVFIKSIGGNDEDTIYSITSTNNGGIITAGEFDSNNVEIGDYKLTGNDANNGMIVKFENIELPNIDINSAETIGSNNDDKIVSVAKTSDGGYVVGGYFNNSIDVGNYTLKSKGKYDAMLIKYNSNNMVEWATSVGGLGYDEFSSIAITEDDEIIVCGKFSSTKIKIDDFELSKLSPSDSITNAMLIKYDSKGKAKWATSIKGNYANALYSVSTTQDGGIIAGGFFNDTSLQVGEITLNNNSTDGYADALIVKYNNNGEVEWATSFGGDNSENINSVSETYDGKIIAGGYFNSANIKIGQFELKNNNENSQDALAVKYSSNGEEIEWATSFGGQFNDEVKSTATTSDGGIILAGSFAGTIYLEETSIASSGSKDGIIVKYNNNGELEWYKKIGESGDDCINSVTRTNDGGIITGGYLSSSNTIGNYQLENQGKYDGLVIKYDINGKVKWATNIGGSENDLINSVAEINDEGIIAGGQFYSNTIETGRFTLENQGNNDGMLLKIIAQAGVPEVEELIVENSKKEFKITTDVNEIDGVKGGSISGENKNPYESVKKGETSTNEIKMIPEEGYEIIKVTINDKEYQFTANSDGTYTMPLFTNVTEDIHVVVTYALINRKLTINKVDKDGNKIEGAVFRIESQEVETGEIYSKEVTTNSQGQAIVQLPSGKYEITETKAPEGYELEETAIELDFTTDGEKEITVENKKEARVIVHHYLKNEKGEYTTEKVAEDDIIVKTDKDQYTTSPKLDLEEYELEKDDTGSYVIPGNSTGEFISEETIEVKYYYEKKEIPLIVHHYIEGTATSVPLKDGSLAQDVEKSGKEGENYETNAIDDSLLNSNYELAEIPENANGTYGTEEIEVIYYYKQVKRPLTIIKTGEDGEVLEGIKFSITDTKNSKTTEYTTDEEGRINVTLDPGIYVIVETETKDDYQLPENATQTITISKEKDEYEIDLTNSKKRGTVITHYYIEGTTDKVPSNVEGEVVEDVVQTGIIGDIWVTKEAENVSNKYIFVRAEGYTSGEYKEGTQVVTYYYRLKTPKIENPIITKESKTEKVTDPSQSIDYTIKYNATIDEYIGNATITITDKLPYEIDTETSNISNGTYNSEDQTITWVETRSNIDTYANGAEEINISKEITLVYKEMDVTKEKVTNTVTGNIKLETPEKEDTKEATEEIPTEYLTNITVNKVWNDNEIQAQRRPGKIRVVVKKGTEIVEAKEVSSEDAIEGKENQWAITFTGLEKYDEEGKEIEYTVDEEEIEEDDLKFYDKDVTEVKDNQATIRNTFKRPEDMIEVKVSKVWEDNNNVNGKRPERIRIVLTGDGKTYNQTIEKQETNIWEAVFKNLPKYDENGQEIEYKVEEQEEEEGEMLFYEKVGITGNTKEGYIITNRFKVPDEKVKVTVNKVWVDNEIQEERRPKSIELVLKNGETEVERAEINKENMVSGNKDQWQYIFTDLPKYDDKGNIIGYTVEEIKDTEEMKFYETKIGDMINEVVDGKATGNRSVTITNTFIRPTDTKEVTVTKIWEDNSDEAEKRPESINVQLKNGNTVVKEQKINGTENAVAGNDNEWQYTFVEVQKYDDNGREIVYSADETEVNKGDLQFYTKTLQGTTLINTFTQSTDQVNVTVTKKWVDSEEQSARRPESIIIQVKNGMQVVRSQEITAEDNGVQGDESTWEYTFIDLPKYDSMNNIINYTVDEIEKKEGDLDFYSKNISGTTITNTFKRPEDKISITANKVWVDQDDVYKKRPDTIILQVKEGETVVKEKAVTKEDDWTYTFTGLDKYDEEGKEIEYRIDEKETEEEEMKYYTKEIGEITNKEGETEEKEGTITNRMTKLPGRVIVRYKDINSKEEISNSEIEEGIVGEGFDISEHKKEIPGYTLVKEPEELTGTYTEKAQERVYYYAKNTKVIVKYLEKDSTPEDDGDNVVLDTQIEIPGYEGQAYNTQRKIIEGYTFVESKGKTSGTMTKETIEVAYYYAKNTSVIVRYLEKDDTKEDNTDNKELIPDRIINGYVGQNYETEQLEFNNYTFIESTNNTKGEMTEETIEVIYYYAQNTKVIVKYLEKDNTPEDNTDNIVLHADIVIDGHEGKEYETTQLKIENYTYVESTNNTKGEMTKEVITVIYYYAQNTKATVQHIDKETGEILKQETKEGKVGDIFETHAENFEGYILVEAPEEPNVEMTKEEQILKYYYVHVSGGVIEKHIDEITGELLYSEEHKGNEGDPYNIPSKEFEGYDLVEEKLPTNSTGEMTKEVIEVKYYYIKKASVRVEYIDKETNEKLTEDVIINGHENDEYKTEEKEFKGYNLIETPENAEGKMTITENEDGTYNTEIVVRYYYEKEAGGVKEKHIDINSGKVLAEKEHKGSIGERYNIPSREFEGYDLVEDRLPTNSTGEMAEEEIEVIYYYEKQTKVRVEYIDKQTGEKLDEEEIKGHEGDPYETEEKEFDGYDLIEIPSNSKGEMEEKEIVVKYYYQRRTEVEVQYLEKDTGYKLAENENITGYVGEKYKTEGKEIPYYKFVESTKNTEGEMTKDKITVIYYYEKQKFNLSVDKWVSRVSVDGIGQVAQNYNTKDQIYKLDIHRNKVNTAEVKITYTIRVTNIGEIEGTTNRITEVIPQGYNFNQEDNKTYWEENNGILTTEELKEEIIKPGEYREIEVVLRWNKGDGNFGQKNNTVVINELSNPAGYEDVNEEDNSDRSEMLLTVATGLDSADKAIVIGIIEIVLIITLGLLLSYKKKEKHN